MSTKSKGSPHLSVTVIKINLCYDIDPYFIQNKFTHNSGNKNKSTLRAIGCQNDFLGKADY